MPPLVPGVQNSIPKSQFRHTCLRTKLSCTERGNQSNGDNFDGVPNIDHTQPFVRSDMMERLRWMRTKVGSQDFRFDFLNMSRNISVERNQFFALGSIGIHAITKMVACHTIKELGLQAGMHLDSKNHYRVFSICSKESLLPSFR